MSTGEAAEHRAVCLESAEHWERLATERESMVAYERERGIQPVSGLVAGLFAAADYRRTAKALRLEAETGKQHCSLCFGQHPNHQHKF